jgi:hypothetical protein
MSDAVLNLAVTVGWPLAPVAMVLIMLASQATGCLWDSDDFGGPSGRPYRRRCVAEWRRLREQFGRYVGEDVARRALQHDTQMGGQEHDVAVLFVDLVGSSALVTGQRPGEVVELLNQFSKSWSTSSIDTAHSSISWWASPSRLRMLAIARFHLFLMLSRGSK